VKEKSQANGGGTNEVVRYAESTASGTYVN
jgi:hypothetical protein